MDWCCHLCCVCCRGMWGGRCGCILFPLTFRISCVIWAAGLASHTDVSCSRPVPSKFLINIISPLSWICSLHLFADRYTSALFSYSTGDRDILHFIGPLFLLIAAYSWRLNAFEAHSIAMRFSNLGVATRIHPVSSAKSLASCLESALFQSSTLPW